VKPFIIYPNNPNKVRWDVLMSLILVLSVITTPIDLAFQNYGDNNLGYKSFLYAIDILFLIDIIVNFNSAFEDDYLEIIDDRKSICLNYIKLWFFIDFFSIFPFELVLNEFMDRS
jgi:hypothetical protein